MSTCVGHLEKRPRSPGEAVARPREQVSISSKARIAVAERLPAELQAKLKQEIGGAGKVTDSLVDEINNRLAICEQYDISVGRFRYYLRKLRKGGEGEASVAVGCKESALGEEVDEPQRWPKQLREHRRRQQSVAAILDATFGKHGDCNPELWERRAYLMLVGMVYERLSAQEADLETDELVRLAKVLAENRRVEVRARQREASAEPWASESGNGRLPDRFGDVVRQVYGTNFQMPSSRSVESPSENESDDLRAMPEQKSGSA